MALNDYGKIFRKSHARDGDTCILCDREIPEGKLIIRRDDNKRIICLLCMMALAETE
jgi:hypothetical protein